jgi:hypothetical protein
MVWNFCFQAYRVTSLLNFQNCDETDGMKKYTDIEVKYAHALAAFGEL